MEAPEPQHPTVDKICAKVCETENTGRPLVGRGRISLRIRPHWQAFFIVSGAQSCPALCDCMDGSTPGFPVLHHLRIFHTLSLILTATSVRVAITTIPPLHSCGRRDVESLENGSQVTAGSGRTRTGLALSVLKVLFFHILGPSLSEGSPSGSVESCLSLSTNIHPLLPPASLF